MGRGGDEKWVRDQEKAAKERAEFYKENPDQIPEPDQDFIDQIDRDNKGNNNEK